MLGGFGPINFWNEFGLAAIDFGWGPWPAFEKTLGPKTEIVNSGSGGFGPINFWKEFGWAAIKFDSPLGRPFAKMVGARAEFMNSVSGGLGRKIGFAGL